MKTTMLLVSLLAFVTAARAQSGPAWTGYAANPQHTAAGAVETQTLKHIQWHSVLDRVPDGPLALSRAHYASPLVTAAGTAIIAVKVAAVDGWRIHAGRAPAHGLLWHMSSDYIAPPHDWEPAFPMALSGAGPLLVAGKAGTVLVRTSPDLPVERYGRIAFYGMDLFRTQEAALAGTIMIDTPITADGHGNAWFGFVVTGANPAGLSSGIARISLSGPGRWITAGAAAQDPGMTQVAMGCAPALSADGKTVYMAVSNGAAGVLVGLDSTTLAPRYRAALLDPASGSGAWISDDSSASPTVGPDGDVYYGVLENPFPAHNDRGWLLHFSADLRHLRTPGSFGWDETVSVLPAAGLPAYKGSSPYLLVSKANNYRGMGTGDGQNRMAVLDPNGAVPDMITPAVATMRTVETVLGPTAVPGQGGATYAWSVSAAAVASGVSQAGGSAVITSDDGRLYRWNLAPNTLDPGLVLAAPGTQAYSPSVIQPDGSVLAIASGTLFSVGDR